MYARTNTVRGDPKSVDAGIVYVRDEVMPTVTGVDGCIGVSMLADRDSGRCIVTTAWQTEEAMRASEAGVRAIRERAGEIFGATPEAEEWEIAILHRVHETGDGCRTRVVWGTSEASRLDDMLSSFRMDTLPKVEELPGFASFSMMVNRADGRSVLSTTYDSAAALRNADEKAARIRSEASAAMGIRIDEVAEFDLVIAHLRVPETV